MNSSSEPSAALFELLLSDDESGVQGIGRGDLQRLKSGEIDIEQYLEAAVRSVTSHLESILSAERLEAMREILRSQLVLHPALVELVNSLKEAEKSEER